MNKYNFISKGEKVGLAKWFELYREHKKKLEEYNRQAQIIYQGMDKYINTYCFDIIRVMSKEPDEIHNYYSLESHKGVIVISHKEYCRTLKYNVNKLIKLGVVQRVSPGRFKINKDFVI